MTVTYERLLKESARLPLRKRLDLIEHLSTSLDQAAKEKAEWSKELDRRWRRFKNSKGRGLSWQQVKELTRAEYDRKS